jgi:hypothetical protein
MTDESTDGLAPMPSGLVTAAGVILLVIGSLVGILAFLGFLAWALLGEITAYERADFSDGQLRAALGMGQTLFVLASVGLSLALAHFLAGIGVLRRRMWARLLGVLLHALSVGLWALVLLSTIVVPVPPIPADSTLAPDEYQAVMRIGFTFIRAFAIVGLLVSAFGMEVLARRKREFA